MTGSEHNDEFYIDEHGKMRTRTNRSGGIQVFSVLESLISFFSRSAVYDGHVLLDFTYIIYIEYQGGISNGEIINMRIAFKPTATIGVSPISSLSLSLI